MIDGEWDDFVPIRLPVDWEYRGEAGIHPEIEGITGKEVVQLYTRDHYATIAPPLKKLQRFTKIELSAKEKKTVNFTLSEKDLRFFGIENKWISENGKFSIFINQLEEEFTLIKS